jgi:hypothetical protein
MLGSTQISPRVRELTNGREQVEYLGFRYRPRSTVWERS